ncbi:hypothetical protein OU787_17430 [Kitasatospora sp. YST-16]|uniref:hypothetical protein n=1 Tax=Kitasatospora sp. YST-16 TaxID=2998080 RepID=UPI0022846BAC|nr:hypothetical protein [Kitasatospora sp. YST-16]WAL73132.1 hypothetical protein OU787_17430 [Kitasatospora sp. YST-16]WNW39186.1 hypothetical protein RKE32_17395 [Streptomyces sp. Li-HN-5-13]
MVTHPVPYVASITVSVPNNMSPELVTWEPCPEPVVMLGGLEITACEDLHGVLRSEGMRTARTFRTFTKRYPSFRLEAREVRSGRLVGMAEWVWSDQLGQYRQWDVFTGCEWGEHGWLPALLDELANGEDGAERAAAA